MPHSDPVNWQPISQMSLIASMIDAALDDTRTHIKTLTRAQTRPHVLDDATVDRIDRVHTEQLELVDLYARQIGRWRSEKPSAEQTDELDRMEEQNQQLGAVTVDILALARELRGCTIERVLGMSDAELGLQALLGGRPTGRR